MGICFFFRLPSHSLPFSFDKSTSKKCCFHIPYLGKTVGRHDEFAGKRKPNGIAFYWISFCINFHRFFSFLMLLLLLSSSFGKLDLFVCVFLRSILSTILPLVSSASSPIFEIIRNNIWKSTSKRWFHKLFTSYTTKYRHRYIDTTFGQRWWWCLCASGARASMTAKIHKLCSILKLNLYTKLHIYWILPTTHSLSHTHTNIRT